MTLSASSLEKDLAQRWESLPPGQPVPLTTGGLCWLRFAGRPGGPQGPDRRDAVLQFGHVLHVASDEQITGDVEFHIRCSDWYAHQHHTDARYNNVVLHVVLLFDSVGPILRQDGQTVPVCSLNDLVPTLFPQPLWPCQCIMPFMKKQEQMALLQRAGLLRFEQKTQGLLAHLRAAQPYSPFSVEDVCLIPALVEALGYGRDRTFFRAVGLRLVGLASDIPEPAGRAAEPSPLDAGRLRVCGELVEQWRVTGAWETMQRVITMQLASPNPYEKDAEQAHTLEGIARLRALFPGLSAARADILIINVVLPFAAAVAHLRQDHALLQQAHKLYSTFPGLASNQVTRSMRQQLGLEREPKNACQQQGLHYIYAQTCREKQCNSCIVVGREE